MISDADHSGRFLPAIDQTLGHHDAAWQAPPSTSAQPPRLQVAVHESEEDDDDEIGEGNADLVDSQEFDPNEDFYFTAEEDDDNGGYTDEEGLDLDRPPELLHAPRQSRKRRRRQKLRPAPVDAGASEDVDRGGATPRTCSGAIVDLNDLTVDPAGTVAGDLGV